MEHTCADALVECLVAAGIDTVYGVPGEHCLDVVDAIGRHPDIRLVAVRHESNAAFMADAEAKLTGRIGACLGTASVGAVNLMSGLNVSHHDSTPVVAVLGQVGTNLRGRDAWQELDLAALLAPLTRSAVEVTRPDRLPELAVRTLAASRAGRPGPVAIVVPEDVARQHCDAPTPPLPAPRPPGLTPEDTDDVIARLRAARRPVIVAGGGVAGAGARTDLLRFADATGIPVATAFRRSDAFPGGHPGHLGSLGLGSTPRTARLLRTADLVLVVGCRLSELTTLRYTFPTDEQDVVHIDVDAGTLAHRLSRDGLGLVADAGSALRALGSAWPEDVRVPHWWTDDDDPADAEAGPAGRPTPAAWSTVAEHLERLLPDDAVLTSDAGDFFVPVARAVRFGGERRYLGPTSGTMGYGLPAAIAAKLAGPHRTVVAVCGDGGFGMSLVELATAVRDRIPVIAVVFNDDTYGSIERHQRNRYDGRRVGVGLRNPAFDRLAESFSAYGERVREPDEFPAAFARAVESGLPAVLEIPAGQEAL
ncbi:MAG: thiamine pyrophosphate-binding protein [Streptosporangiales bacterium]|nr:thiamine pyrophosphate-binding protein [Streptosporangiales bacterium]